MFSFIVSTIAFIYSAWRLRTVPEQGRKRLLDWLMLVFFLCGALLSRP